MGRADVQAIKLQLTDIESVARRLGLWDGPRRPGRQHLLVPCPAHDDRTPSCSIREHDDGLSVHCFGCDWSGDVFDLVAAVQHLDVRRDFRRVVDAAADLAGVSRLPVEAPALRAQRVSTQTGPDRSAATDAIARVLLPLGRLDGSPVTADVCAYLGRRRVLAEAVTAGWAGLPGRAHQAAWCRMLTDTLGSQALADSGLANLRDGVMALRHPEHRLVIPWRDRSGRVVALQRRRLDDLEPRYVFGVGCAPTSPLGIEHLVVGGVIVLVEGAIEVLARRCMERAAGRSPVVLGLPSASTWRPEWATHGKGRRVVLALDADAAGDRAAERIAPELMRAGAISVVRTVPREANDWAELLARRGA